MNSDEKSHRSLRRSKKLIDERNRAFSQKRGRPKGADDFFASDWRFDVALVMTVQRLFGFRPFAAARVVVFLRSVAPMQTHSVGDVICFTTLTARERGGHRVHLARDSFEKQIVRKARDPRTASEAVWLESSVDSLTVLFTAAVGKPIEADRLAGAFTNLLDIGWRAPLTKILIKFAMATAATDAAVIQELGGRCLGSQRTVYPRT